MSGILTSIEGGLERAFTWNQQKIDLFFQTLEGDINYVKGFFVQEGPTILTDAEWLLSVITVIPSVPANIVAILTAGITAFRNIVSGLTQASQQGSGAQGVVGSVPADIPALQAARTVHSDLVSAMAQARRVIATSKQVRL